ncbi:MAG: beta galactosidase jelly roll domain-containing protein [Planctomycetes bacterium]|nr:beta galactosidase jelly roll domain-containing protein [Planctomycetota bacterium]
MAVLEAVLCCAAIVVPRPAVAFAATKSIPLDTGWTIVFDKENRGRELEWHIPGKLPASKPIRVPGIWEAMPEGVGYDGVAWYSVRFRIPANWNAVAARLHFGQVNYLATVWLNGQLLGEHEGGYLPFDVECGSALKIGSPNTLVVRVLDPGKTPIDGLDVFATPNAKETWYVNWGGLAGAVELRPIPAVEITDLVVVTDRAGRSADVTVRGTSHLATEQRLDLRASITDQSPRTIDLATSPGPFERTFRLTVAEAKPWTPETPNLFRVRVEVADGQRTLDARETDVGFREFVVKDGDFQLNGKKVFLRGVLYQPYYPETLAQPPNSGWVQREVTRMKDAGFNLVRAHVRLAPRELIDECNRQGLLVMEEPTCGWLHGPDIAAIETRVKREIEGMIRRDRNDPCVVIWGILNEMSDQVWRVKESLCRYARSLDPTRLVFDDSGGWSGAHYYAPDSDQPVSYFDDHPYRRSPLSGEDETFFRTIGESGKLGFVSEFGFGGLTDLRLAVGGFGDRTFLDDAQLYANYLERARKDFDAHHLDRVFLSMERMWADGQRIQAECAHDMAAAMLANPKLDGYVFTQWQDAYSECSAGLVDVFGAPKAALEAFRDLHSGTPLPAAPTPAIAPGRPPATPVQLLGADDRLRSRLESLGFKIAPEAAVILAFSGPDLWDDEPAFLAMLSAFQRARRGATLAILDAPDADGPLVASGLLPPFKRTRAVGDFIGFFHFAADHPLFDGLAKSCFMGRAYRNVIPDETFEGLDGETLAGTIGGHSEFLGSDVIVLPCGAGRIVLSQLRLRRALDRDPLAARLLVNLVRWASTPNPATSNAERFDGDETLARYRKAKEKLQRWAFLAPFPSDEARSGLDQPFIPETDAAFDLGKEWVGAGGPMEWRIVTSTPDGELDFVRALGVRERKVGYAFTTITSPEARDVTLALGSDDGIVVFWNGKRIHENRAMRAAAARQDVVKVHLEKGRNSILVKIDNVFGEWGFFFEVLDADGKECVPGLRVTPDSTKTSGG